MRIDLDALPTDVNALHAVIGALEAERANERAEAEAALPAVAAENVLQGPAAKERLSLPDHLEREDVTLDIDAAACPCCGGAIHQIGETVSEMLDFVPARRRVIRVRRPKYGC